MRTATRVTISTMGLIAGLAGIEHGIGEIVQGNERPDAVTFESWPDTAAFEPLAGEPAMSLVPNFLVTGILAVAVSLVFIAWVTRSIEHPHGGVVLIGISGVLLLVGGGFGPPLVGVILGAAATRLDAPPRVIARLGPGTRHLLASLWPWCLGVAVAAWLTLMPGLVLIEATAGLPRPEATTTAVIVMAFASLLLSLLTAFAWDLPRLEARGMSTPAHA